MYPHTPLLRILSTEKLNSIILKYFKFCPYKNGKGLLQNYVNKLEILCKNNNHKSKFWLLCKLAIPEHPKKFEVIMMKN